MKVKCGGKIMKKFFGSRAKTYSQLTDDGSKDKIREGHKKECHKKCKFGNCKKDCLEATHLENRLNYQDNYKNDIGSVEKVIKNS